MPPLSLRLRHTQEWLSSLHGDAGISPRLREMLLDRLDELEQHALALETDAEQLIARLRNLESPDTATILRVVPR